MKRVSPWHRTSHMDLPEHMIARSAPINALPDSLLLEIFEIDYYRVSDQARTFPLSTYLHPDEGRTTIKSILKVCKRWNGMATPLLYRAVRIELCNTRGNRIVRRLLSTLQSEPQLRSFTREIGILLDGITLPAFSEEVAMQLVQLLRLWETNLRSASIHGYLEAPEGRPILLQLGKIPLQSLTCSGFFGGIPLNFLLTHFDLSKAKKLTLSRVRTRAQDNRWPRIKQEEMVSHLQRHRPSDLKELDLSDPYLPARILDILFRLPKSLERLKMTYLMHSTDTETFNVAMIEELMHRQKHSLRSVELGHMCQVNEGLDLTRMATLEILKLNESTVFSTSAVKTAVRLAAPKLKYFQISYSSEDQHDDDALRNMQQNANWLQEFVAARKSALPNELDVLEEIELVFYPGLEYGFTWEDVRQAWQSLDQARAKVETFGVKLTYPRPIPDDEDWQKYLEGSWAPLNPYTTDDSDMGDTEADVAAMCCSDMEHCECIASASVKHNHDPTQMRLCRKLSSPISCVH